MLNISTYEITLKTGVATDISGDAEVYHYKERLDMVQLSLQGETVIAAKVENQKNTEVAQGIVNRKNNDEQAKTLLTTLREEGEILKTNLKKEVKLLKKANEDFSIFGSITGFFDKVFKQLGVVVTMVLAALLFVPIVASLFYCTFKCYMIRQGNNTTCFSLPWAVYYLFILLLFLLLRLK